MAISDDEFTAQQDYAAYTANLARNSINEQLADVPDGDVLAALLAKLRTAPAPPTRTADPAAGVTIDRYVVDANQVPERDPGHDSDRLIYVGRHGDRFVISRYPWSDSPLWNFTLGDWHNPWADDSYDADHYERPETEAIAKARQIVGLT
ncbi:hypothetical protein [Nonomuraea sp. NPDC003214]